MKPFTQAVFLTFTVFSIANTSVSAAEVTERNLTSIACQKDKGICSVQLNGDPVGNRNCVSNVLQFNTSTDKNADAVLSLLTAAFFAGKKVRFDISEQCSQQDRAPTFEGFVVVN